MESPKRLIAIAGMLTLGGLGCSGASSNSSATSGGSDAVVGGNSGANGGWPGLGGSGTVATGGAKNAGGASNVGVTATTGGAGGAVATGGTLAAGGSANVGGMATSLGGSGAIGETKSAGGTSNLGGTKNASGAGGTVATGGAPVVGGSANSGGTTSIAGGARATGGTSSVGGTTGGTAVASGLLDPSYVTTWNPGVLKDSQLNLALGSDGLPVRTTVCASPKPGDDLNAAISSCPEGQVVQLAASTYTVSTTISITKGVVLRGAGSKGSASGGTTIVKTGGNSVVAIGTGQDQACYSNSFGTAYALTQNAVKETSTVYVGSNASSFSAGDLALIDQADDSTVQEGDCSYFKRVDKRSVSERVEVAAIDTANGTLTLSSPLHWTFQSASPHLAQIARVTQKATKWAGIEGVLLQGGTNPGYNGQMAGGIDVTNAAYCWVKDVQTDGTIGGIHVAMTGTYRCVVRDSHVHNSANYGFGTDCYGIVMRCGTADNLIENNIARYMNKPIQFSVSGGGNVVGYNYVDNSWATPASFQEDTFDTHCSFPHMELMEGNYVPHMKASITHGNSGYLTYFRNYSSSQFAPPAVYGSTDKQTGNILAVGFDAGDINMTVVGNVLGSSAATDLGTATISDTYMCFGTGGACIIYIGATDKSDVAYASLWLHGNYDTVTPGVVWNPLITTHDLPASLYLSAKPAWWPSGSAWPWAGSDLSPMVGTLPAKARSDSL